MNAFGRKKRQSSMNRIRIYTSNIDVLKPERKYFLENFCRSVLTLYIIKFEWLNIRSFKFLPKE